MYTIYTYIYIYIYMYVYIYIGLILHGIGLITFKTYITPLWFSKLNIMQQVCKHFREYILNTAANNYLVIYIYIHFYLFIYILYKHPHTQSAHMSAYRIYNICRFASTACA